MRLNAWPQMFWNDSRLSWDPEEWHGVDRMRVPAKEVIKRYCKPIPKAYLAIKARL
jgi:hypothetical protein